ncbi:Global nitrogen regulator [Rubripirellula amarantea]|uniref:Global nitrogen regulator n=1 Tax=Rubripirellula amarantea TaxID=2527999 RepID=A0A5C5WM40_9BACT|nr:Crp/Fnr family transcriptional regulator [Rubripirellula amarantea]TWT51151.1 Global nitrogen regulator [Rubripirellula amarantea]
MPNIVSRLKKCDLFGALLPEQIENLAKQSRSHSFRTGESIYQPREIADSVFVLSKGLVKLCHFTSDGKQSILALVEPRELFAERAIFEDQTRDEYVEVMEPSKLVEIPAQEIRQLMTQRNEFAIEVAALLASRRNCIERRLKYLLFSSNHDRLVHLLLDLAEQFGIATDEGICLRIKLSHQELANLIGSTRETITIVLGQLKSEGAVSGGRRRIVLTDPERLAHSVQRQLPESLALPVT